MASPIPTHMSLSLKLPPTPETPLDTTCCRELTKGGADRSPQLFCGSCDFHVLSSSQGIFSSSSFPLARSKKLLNDHSGLSQRQGRKKNHTSLLNSSFPGREVLGWVAKLELAHSPADMQLLLVPGSGFGWGETIYLRTDNLTSAACGSCLSYARSPQLAMDLK